MAGNTHLTHLPLQAIRPNLISIATALRTGVGNNYDDIVNLRPETACRNAVALVRYASPMLERGILILAPFGILAYGIYNYVWKGLDLADVIDWIRSRFIASVTVPAKYALHEQILGWMAENNVGVDARSVTVHWMNTAAQAPGQAASTSPQAPGINLESRWPSLSGLDMFNPGLLAANEPAAAKNRVLSYIPAIGSTAFTFRGRSLWLDRQNSYEQEVLDHNGRAVKGKTKSRESDITISCYSILGGLQPVQDFLEHVSELNKVDMESQVRIHRLSKYVAEGETWDPKVIARPIRNLDSVSMEKHKKKSLIDHINTYLSPKSKSWYANRGIPWRRGYLFYGPPGTGKTSFCTALAGHFDLELYILPLSSPQITDDILEMCFDALPPRCLVLLEDVDSAGIGREKPKKKKNKSSKSKKTAHPFSVPVPRRNVTLSGLLNTIDGPVSHEGRVLVMTSNSPDNLDAALLRPGRIDKKVLFGNASPEVVEQLFLHIYVESPQEVSEFAESPKYDLNALSKQFAREVPEEKLTPAEIQNYLLETRQDPVAAVANARSWADGVIQTKSQGRNVEEFQGQIGAEEETPKKVESTQNFKGHFAMNGDAKADLASSGGYPAFDGSPSTNGASGSWIKVKSHISEDTNSGEELKEMNGEARSDEHVEEEANVEHRDGEDELKDDADEDAAEDEDEDDEEDEQQQAQQVELSRLRSASARSARQAARSLAMMRQNMNLTYQRPREFRF